MIFLTETKCKIRFIYVGFNCKRKKWGKKCLEIMSIEGGGRRLMEKSILNFHFDCWNPSLMCIKGPPYSARRLAMSTSRNLHLFSILREFISTLDIISPLQLLSILIFKCNFNLQGSYQIIMIIFKSHFIFITVSRERHKFIVLVQGREHMNLLRPKT